MGIIRFLLTVIILLTAVTGSQALQAQQNMLDTLVDAGSYKLFFHIIKGKGVPIIFEAGGGETSSVWNDILPDIAEITGATLITYDRAGFGKSTFDTSRHGILNGVTGLETALHKLGYDGKIILVAHSQGGIYSKLYASRHAEKIQGAVLIDISTSCWFSGNRLADFQKSNDIEKEKYRPAFPGLYYQLNDLTANFNYIRKVSFPTRFPITDLVSDHLSGDSLEVADWKRCHADLVREAPNRTGIRAAGTGHYIYRDNPQLVILSIASMYSKTLTANEKAEVLDRAVEFSLKGFNQNKSR